MKTRLECRHFHGDKPCKYRRGGAGGCEDCRDFAPMGTRILIVKLDAIGDVARTTCLLPALERKYRPMHVTWLVAPEGAELLRNNPLIDVLLPYDAGSLERLRVEKFDLVLSLDKTPRACAVAELVTTRERHGFGLCEYGTVYPFDAQAAYAYELGLSDELKFRKNTRTYQDVIFEVAGLKFEGEEYLLPLEEEHQRFGAEFRSKTGVAANERVIGLNLGGTGAFANKMWGVGLCVEFVQTVRKRLPKAWVVLLGAERERDKIARVLATGGDRLVSADTTGSLKRFQAMLGACDVVVTGDSLGMHLAIAEKRPVVVLFGPTAAQEIEIYGRGEKIVSPIECVPCYRGNCDRVANCMNAIPPEKVVEAVERLLH